MNYDYLHIVGILNLFSDYKSSYLDSANNRIKIRYEKMLLIPTFYITVLCIIYV